MLDRLKIVYGAVQERALLSVLSHVYIYDARVQAGNGRISIDAPFPELAGLTAVAPADRFLAAIEASQADAKVLIEETRLVIRSGRFRARIPIMTSQEFPRAEPDLRDWELDAPLLDTLRRLRPFVAADATNVWSTGILFTQKHACATNNVCLLSEPCSMLDGTSVEAITVPGSTIDEILRMKEEPTGFGVTANSITFYFGDTWIKSQLIMAQWPVAKVGELMKAIPKKMPTVPDDLADAVEKVLPFCKDAKFPVVIFSKDGVSTEDFEHQAEVTGIELPDIRFNGMLLKQVLTSADKFQAMDASRAAFTIGPARGIISGVRA